MEWFFPSWNGDVRIESAEDDPRRTIVTVIEPTAHELDVLRAVQGVFRAKGWIADGARLWTPEGSPDRQQTGVNASLLKVGLILSGRLKPGVATLTAITTEEGHTEAMGSGEPGYRKWLGIHLQGDAGQTPARVNFRDEEGYAEIQRRKKEEARRREEEKKRKEEEEEKKRIAAFHKRIEEEERRKEEARRKEEEERRKEEEKRRKEEERKKKAAATVKAPTRCCPDAVPGVVEPAQEVLLRFCTPEQREQWLKERRMLVVGGFTGHRYMLAHRHTSYAIRNTKVCFDLDDRCVMHFHDWTVPPEEEILAGKLILEHREHWLRNEATCFTGRRVFKNPFGDMGDGTHDAGFTRAIGDLAKATQALRRYGVLGR